MPRMHEMPCGALLCLAVLTAPLGGVEGQTVRGRVLDAQSDRSVADARIRLFDRLGASRGLTRADSIGGYQLAVPEPGFYRLRADQLGYETYESEELEVQDTTDVLSVDLLMRPSPIPMRGIEVSTAQVNRRLQESLGINPARLRIRPIRSGTIREHAMFGRNLSGMIRSLDIPNLEVVGSRGGACYQFRGRGCLTVFLDGARLNRNPDAVVSLEMLNTVVLLLPNELIAYPSGAVHLYTIGFMR